MVLAVSCAEAPSDPESLVAEAVSAWWSGETEKALAIAERGSRTLGDTDTALAARFDLLRAEILLARGGKENLEAADSLIAGVYDIALAEKSVRARWQFLRGYAAFKKNEVEAAISTLDEAIRGARDSDLPDVVVDALNVRGQALSRLKRFDEAKSAWQSAFEAAAQVGDDFRSAAALTNLGLAEIGESRFDEAITYLERARTRAPPEGAEALRAVVVLNLSICWWRLGELDRAIEARREAIEIHRRAGFRLYVAQGLGMLGQLHRSRGDLEAAVENLREAIAIAREIDNPESAFWSVLLARTLVDRGDLDEAEQWIQTARATGSAETLALVSLVEGELAAATADYATAVKRFGDAAGAVPDRPELLWQAQAGGAAARLGLGRPEEARREYARAIATIEAGRERLFRISSRLSFLTEPIRVYQDYVALLLEKPGFADEALKVIEASRARTLLGGATGSFESSIDVESLVRTARDHGVTLVSYWISPRGSFAWIFDRDGASRISIGPIEGLDDLVRTHASVIEKGWRDPLDSGHPAGRELYRRLVAPLRDRLPNEARVIIIPDGPLAVLNFETLVVDGARPHYFLEDATLAVAPALAPLAARRPPRRASLPSALLVGDPEQTDPAFPRLPHASEELEAVAARLSTLPVTMLRRAQATPEAVLATPLEDFTWLHFTAHALSSESDPLNSAVILSPGTHSARLYARDILERRLSAQLVTLSACRTAGSRVYSGEGLVGFAWAFLRAGAAQVVAGMWDVGDRSTVQLMEELYAGLIRGQPSGEALRAAKLHLIRASPTMRKPFYWAPFQLYTRTAEF